MWKITRIELKNYQRFLVSNIPHFVMDITEEVQIILGTNGSGKSSLLGELTPMPANKNDFAEGGFKKVTLEHNGDTYLLVSDFTGSSAKYGIYKNGDTENLNKGGTVTVQKTLVEELFLITSNMLDFMTGQVLFTDMGPDKRREFITSLSKNDLSYAMRVYNTLKGRLRDCTGAAKHLKSRLVEETNRLMSGDLGEGLSELVDNCTADINVLFQNRVPNAVPVSQVTPRIEQVLKQLQEASRELLAMKGTHTARYAQERFREQLEAEFAEVQAKVKAKETLMEHHGQTLTKLNNAATAFANLEFSSVDELNEEIERVKEAIDSLLKSPVVERFGIIPEPEKAKLEMDSYERDVPRLLQELTPDPERRFSKEKLELAKERRRGLEERQREVNVKVDRILARIAHIEHAHDETCPKCQYVWKPGITDMELSALQSNLEKGRGIQESLRREIQECDQFLEESGQYLDTLKQLKQRMVNSEHSARFWTVIFGEGFLDNPGARIGVLLEWASAIEACTRLATLQQSLKKLEALPQTAEQFQKELLDVQKQEAEDGIESCMTALEVLKQERKELQKAKDFLYRFSDLTDTIKQCSTNLLSLMEAGIQGIRREEVDGSLKVLQSQLAATQHKLDEKKAVEAVITQLKGDIADVEERASSLALLVDSLSPVDGLIAEQMFGFINLMVDQVNAIISQVWSYDLQVKPCGLDGSDMDYRFPLSVSENDHCVPDIKHGSSAQREIVNFAFRLVATFYKGYVNHPLYLDELGATFDEQHRERLVMLIKQLVATQKCSQLFMVSHYASSYGGFTNNEVCVLDTTNITLPVAYNQHVSFG